MKFDELCHAFIQPKFSTPLPKNSITDLAMSSEFFGYEAQWNANCADVHLVIGRFSKKHIKKISSSCKKTRWTCWVFLTEKNLWHQMVIFSKICAEIGGFAASSKLWVVIPLDSLNGWDTPPAGFPKGTNSMLLPWEHGLLFNFLCRDRIGEGWVPKFLRLMLHG